MQPPAPSIPIRSAARAEPVMAAAAILFALLCGFVLLHGLGAVVVDDAAISLRYGLTLFQGHGLRLTPVSQPVEGFSNPLWTVLLGLAYPLHLSPVAFMRWLGILLGFAALPVFALWGPCARGGRLQLEDAIVPALAALNPSYLTWIASGLETGLFALLLGLAGVALLRERGGWLGIALGLLCLTHPEAPLLVLGAVGVWALGLGLARRRPGAPEARLVIAGAVIAGGYLLFRLWYFADLLPNTYYAKRPWDFHAAEYIGGFVRAYAPLIALWIVGLGLACVRGFRHARAPLLATLWIAAAFVFAWVAKGDWMGEWRFFAPYLPLFGVPAAAAISAWRAREGLRWPAIALLPLLTAGGGIGSVGRYAWVKGHPQFPYDFVAGNAQRVRALCNQLGQRRPLLGMPDLGGLAMEVPQAEIIDVAGLADYAVAHHSLERQVIEDYLVSEGPPVVLDVHGPSGFVVQYRRLMGHYARRGPWLVLRGLSATEDPRCPDGKARALALDGPGLVSALRGDLAQGQEERAIRRWRCAFAYQPDERLPSAEQRRSLSREAVAHANALLASDRTRALRALSLATLLDFGNAQLRRRTERLRSEVAAGH